MAKFKTSTERRQARVRRAIKIGAGGRPRLSVYRSSKHIYAQIIDDLKGGTVVASSIEKTPARTGRRRPSTARRSASWSPSARRKRASPPWCSIAAVISITAASRRWPMRRAKQD